MSKEHPCNCAEQIAGLQKRITELEAALSNHLASGPKMLWTWEEICSFTRKPQRTIDRYVRKYGFPVTHVGPFVVSSTGLIESWLVARQRQLRARNKRAPQNYMNRYWAERASKDKLERAQSGAGARHRPKLHAEVKAMEFSRNDI